MTEVMLGDVDDIPVGGGRAYAVEGRQIAVFRLRDGSLRAIDAVCPHRGGPLADGLSDARVVVCPLHGFTYDLATGDEVGHGGVAVTAYPVRADDAGTIHLTMDGVAARRSERNGSLGPFVARREQDSKPGPVRAAFGAE